MTTYRERREARAERLREWAGGREERADAEIASSHAATAGIPFGQPILVGHHSERRHRNAIEKSQRAATRAVENTRTAERHREKATNIERALDAAIYDDDPDALDRLRAKLAALEERRETMKAENREWLKANRELAKGLTAYERDTARPHPGYALTNLGGTITRTRKRIARLEREAAHPDPRGPGRVMAAKYAGTCAECDEAVEPGDTMTYHRRTREVVCARCTTKGD